MSKRTFRLWVVISFFIFLLSSLTLQVNRKNYFDGHYEHLEFRIKAPFPKYNGLSTIKTFMEGFDRWFLDNFAMRPVLIRLSDLIRYYGLWTSPSNSVVLGEENSLLFADEWSMEAARHEIPFNTDDLERVVQVFEGRARDERTQAHLSPGYCAGHGDDLP